MQERLNRKQIFSLLTLIFILFSLFPIASSIRKRKQIKLKAAELLQGEFVPDEILVKFKPEITSQERQSIHQKYKGDVKSVIPELDIEAVKVEKSLLNGLSDYLGDKSVEYAEPNYILQAMLIPNDPYYAQQWALPKIGAPEAWDIDTGGAEVIVAVIDTGAELDHPDLAEKLIPGKSFVSYTDSSSDDNGHGTYMAGIASAITNNGKGIAGVSWEAKIMPLKAINMEGKGTASDVAAAISYASSHQAKVINLSFGSEQFSNTLKNAVDSAWNKGSLLVAASGNSGNEGNPVFYPAAFQNIIAVSATDQNDQHPSFSSYGSYVDVSAPGVGILSTFVGKGYASADGTSASSAFVSGLAALVWSQNLNLTNQEIKNIIEEAVDDIGPSGKDDYFGFGRINAYQAIITAIPSPTPTPISTPTVTPTPTLSPTPTPGVSPTPSPTPPLSPTPTPTSFLTPTPSPTVSPTPTPTPDPEKAQIIFKIKFQGINQQRPERIIKMVLQQGDEEKYRFESLSVASDQDGVYSGNVMNIKPDAYDFSIKGPTHLQKKFSNIILTKGENNLDWSETELLAGDAKGDNEVNIQDFGILVEDYLKTGESPADFNFDGKVTIQDFRFIVENYLKEGD